MYKCERRCVRCKRALSGNVIMYSGGICPCCGADSESTIVNTTNHVYKLVTVGYKWFILPIKERQYVD